MRQVCEFSLSKEEDEVLRQFISEVRQLPLAEKIGQVYPHNQDQIFFNEGRLIRFLQARENHIEKAKEMWLNWATWYLEEKPETITKESVQEQLDDRKAFLFRHDNKNNPCLVVLVRNIIAVKEQIEQNKKFFFYLMEEGIKQAEKNGTHRLTIIWDGKEFKRSQLNSAFLDFIKIVAKSLQDFYPNRLAAVYVTDPDLLFKIGYSILKPFLNKVITSKIQQIPMKNLKNYFTSDCILPEHGGDQQTHKQVEHNDNNIINNNNNNNQLSQHLHIHSSQHLNIHQNSSHDNNLNNSYLHTEEFHSIANDTQIFFEKSSQNFIEPNKYHKNNNTVQFELHQEGEEPNKQTCCSPCNIF